ncbi:hypothetical protein SLCC85_40309 [Listeria monocytogenes]|nr:hypothetical protein SLCC85_40309 [Listeria monocytogenes]
MILAFYDFLFVIFVNKAKITFVKLLTNRIKNSFLVLRYSYSS